MNRIIKKIEQVMHGSPKNNFFFRYFLYLISLFYSGTVKAREISYKKSIIRSKRLPCIVVSIGNLTLGGTGKTPMTIYTAQLVKQLGYKVVIISRGYKGSAEKSGTIVSDGQTIFSGPETAGDEPFLMALRLKDIPVVVGKNRFKAGMTAVKEFDPDVLILDDAFQHLQLERDINVVLLDHKSPLGNTFLLPRGALREPVSSLLRGDLFVFTRFDLRFNIESNSFDSMLLKQFIRKKPVLNSSHKPYIFGVAKKNRSICLDDLKACSGIFNKKYDPAFLKGQRVFVFSGLANNNGFYSSVAALKCDITDFFKYPDHHFYSDKELEAISRTAIENKVDFILTTDKDYVKIACRISWPVDLVVIGVKISFQDPLVFNNFIKKRLVEASASGIYGY